MQTQSVSIKDKLEILGIEYKEQEKYYTSCPNCHGHQTSLLVTIDDSYVRYKCMREGQCSWTNGKYFKVDSVSGKSILKQHRDKIEVEYDIIEDDDIIPVPEGTIVYRYRDIEGKCLFVVTRIDEDGGKKVIFPMVKVNNEFRFEGYKGKALYGAETLKQFSKVIVVEGEKTADAARKIFTKAAVVTWPGGCNGVNKGDWSLLKDKEVILWPDNDEPGLAAMNKIADIIDSKGVSIVDVTSLQPKYDLADDIPLDTVKTLFNNRKPVRGNDTRFGLACQILSDQFLKNISSLKQGTGLGWENVDRYLRLPQQGLVITSGRTGMGKTTFLINLMVNALRKGEKKLVYFSYEIPAARLLLKTIMTMEGEVYDDVSYKNTEVYIDKIKKNELKAWKELFPLLGNQISITDENYNIKDLIKLLDTDNYENTIVFIDYIQLIPGGSNEARYLTIKSHADSLRALANKRNMVIITGSQLTNGETPYQDSAREGKDIENAAELMLRIWNKTVARVTETTNKGTDYYDDIAGDFIIAVTKNRNGEPGLKFGFNLIGGAKLVPAEQHIQTGEF